LPQQKGHEVLTALWSTKGGSGVSVTAAALAVVMAGQQAETDPPVLLVDLCGDLPAVLGLARPNGPGVGEWLATEQQDSLALQRLAEPVISGLEMIPAGDATAVHDDSATALGAALRELNRPVVVDAGNLARVGYSGHSHPAAEVVRSAERSLLVTRPCYLSLRSAVGFELRPDGVIVLQESGRALNSRDVGDVLNVPVLATVSCDEALARSVDAGVLARRLPRTLARELGGLL